MSRVLSALAIAALAFSSAEASTACTDADLTLIDSTTGAPGTVLYCVVNAINAATASPSLPAGLNLTANSIATFFANPQSVATTAYGAGATEAILLGLAQTTYGIPTACPTAGQAVGATQLVTDCFSDCGTTWSATCQGYAAAGLTASSLSSTASAIFGVKAGYAVSGAVAACLPSACLPLAVNVCKAVTPSSTGLGGFRASVQAASFIDLSASFLEVIKQSAAGVAQAQASAKGTFASALYAQVSSLPSNGTSFNCATALSVKGSPASTYTAGVMTAVAAFAAMATL